MCTSPLGLETKPRCSAWRPNWKRRGHGGATGRRSARHDSHSTDRVIAPGIRVESASSASSGGTVRISHQPLRKGRSQLRYQFDGGGLVLSLEDTGLLVQQRERAPIVVGHFEPHPHD